MGICGHSMEAVAAANLNFSQQVGNVANVSFNAADFGLSTDFIASCLPTCGCSFITNNFFIDSDSSGAFTQAAAVPEPATWAMLVTGFAAIGFLARR